MPDALVALLVAAVAAAYAVGVRRLWSASTSARLVGTAQVVAFAAAVGALLVALASPLEDAAHRSLPWHMVQHLVLLSVVAPLLAVSVPVLAITYALGPRARRRVLPAVRRVTRSQTSPRGWLVWTVAAFVASSAVLVVWHVPALYDAALRHPVLHATEHLTFVASAALLWWMALGAGRRSRRGLGILALFAATLPASALGILMTLAQSPWYAPYGHGATALRDQQVAGAIMWGFGGSALVLGAAALFASWLQHLERLERAPARPPVAEPW